jgi:hypothetical protein
MTATLRREAIDRQGVLDRLYDNRWTSEDYGDDSIKFHGPSGKLIIVSWDPDTEPGVPWIHASISHQDPWRIPGYGELKQMHRAVFPVGYAYQVFAPGGDHINITPNVLHLFGRADGVPVLPNFGRLGTI